MGSGVPLRLHLRGPSSPYDFGLALTGGGGGGSVPEVKGMIDDPPPWLEEWSEQTGAALKDGLRENPGLDRVCSRERHRVPHLHGGSSRSRSSLRTSASCSSEPRSRNRPSLARGARTSTRTDAEPVIRTQSASRLPAERAGISLVTLLFALAAVAWWCTIGEMRGMDGGPWTGLGTFAVVPRRVGRDDGGDRVPVRRAGGRPLLARDQGPKPGGAAPLHPRLPHLVGCSRAPRLCDGGCRRTPHGCVVFSLGPRRSLGRGSVAARRRGVRAHAAGRRICLGEVP